MEPSTRAVIFDLDGVLVDSEPFWQASEVQVLGSLGVPIEPRDCVQTTGLRIDEAVGYWFSRYPWSGAPLDDVAAEIVRRVAALIRVEGRALPGAMNALRAVQHSGHAHAVATSSPHPIIEAVRTRLDLGQIPFFSATDDPAGKPDPAVYVRAAAAMGMPPDRCLAIEDSLPGVQSARAAGMRVVAVEPVDEADAVVALPDLAAYLHHEWL